MKQRGAALARWRVGAAQSPYLRGLAAATLLAMAAACALGPDFAPPQVAVPAAWSAEPPWRIARPADGAPRGPWWTLFADAPLAALELQAQAGNPSLVLAQEHLVQARALARAAAAPLAPQLDAKLAAARARTSAQRPRAAYDVANSATVQNDLSGGLTVHYELDLFGGLRRQAESAQAAAEQARADLANAHLVLTAEVAADYFSLRAVDAEIEVVARTIAAQTAARDFVRARHELGAAAGLDLAQQQAQLDSTVTQINLLRRQRDQFEHALAVLLGLAAPSFKLPPAPGPLTPPAVPVGLPSDLLERRPDIAAAERAVAAANAQIGVARAAYYPSIPLTAGYGAESAAGGLLLNATANLWSLGVAATQPLFDGGRISATVDFSAAAYRSAVAQYRQTVLSALQEVEDGLSGMLSLGRAAAAAEAAVASAQQVVDIARDRYNEGLGAYIEVITAQQALFANQRQQVQISGQRMLTAVLLVKALGGDWGGMDAPTAAASRRGNSSG